MSAKKSVSGSSGNLPALKIGSRVRCTEDGVEGRITWANAVSVKVQWDDGEKVTWRRDSLADRPIEILDPADDEGQVTANPEVASVEQSVATAVPVEEPPLVSPAREGATTEPEQPAADPAVAAVEPAVAEPAPSVPAPSEGQAAPTTPDATAETVVPSKRRRKTPAAPKEKKLSALDAAAKVLAEAGQPLSCQEMITAMAAKGYWTSPGGKTPAATLYSAILREIVTKGEASRFIKTERGKFALGGAR
ncbi:MAG TPA: HTH domain-containing protein [Gemmataceae bacterium]|jgi:hypothetical protein